MAAFDPIALEILWSRLIAIVDEASATLQRTSFSSLVRESNDYAIVLFDAEGSSLAQSTLTIPSFIGTLPVTVRHLLRRFPAETLQPGDVLATNDPWLGTGHLNDINIVVPIFHRGELIAMSASTAHAPDIGGRIISPDNRDVFEEGIRLPMLKLYEAGRPNEHVLELLRCNVRVPDQVIGDVEAQIAANQVSGARLVELVEEYRIPNLKELSTTIQEQSERATRAAIREIPAGVYRHRLPVEGFDGELEIRLAVTVDHERGQIVCDYAGTSPQQPAAYNVVSNYAFAYTAFAVKCLISPGIPNNEGCLRPVTVGAPEGSLLNPRFPAAVGARAAMGHYLPAAVFGALAEAVPERVRAAAGAPVWGIILAGQWDDGRRFAGMAFFNGGMGGARGQDGHSCTSFPSNVSDTPVELLEHLFPLGFTRRELRPNSAGVGQWRGGLGQTVELDVECAWPLSLSLWSSLTRYPAAGLDGGAPGALGEALINGQAVDPKRQRLVRRGDRLTLQVPGGGGYGPAARRDSGAQSRDVEDGLITGVAEAVRHDHSIVP